MRIRAALAALVIAACSRAPREGAPAQPVDNRPSASVPTPPAASADAGPDRACIDACVKSRQMVAMSIEAIEAECARTCALQPADFTP